MSGRRSRRGGGSVFYDQSKGRWVGQLSMGRDETGKRRRSPKVSAATAEACWEKLDEMRAELRGTGTVSRRNVTVRDVVEGLLARPPAGWRSPATIEANTDHAQRVIAAIGRERIATLQPARVDAMLRKMAADGYARATIAGTRGLLARAIRLAERDGLVTRNVALIAEIPDAPRRKSQAMTREQVSALLRLELSPWWRAFLTVAVTTGLRPGEMLGLRWEDVNLDEGVLRVRQALHQSRGQGRAGLTTGTLKTERSRRALRMPAPARAALRALRRSQAGEQLALGCHYEGSGLVFADNAGRARWPQQVAREFARLCDEARLGRRWTLRELRHTFVSQMSDAGIDCEVIADHVGHVNSTVTRSVYRHQLAEQVGAAAAVFDAMYPEVRPS